ncbi:MAG: cell shape determination protein CcmA [Alteromonadaceae bacterium]|nr:cell shape determination protein CcmA [Alteromonadaceae bacterium]|tara:strand:- start:4583 stop:5047 length:465 start_codon:yes stop_codon:yes gene_type:complete
MFGSGKKHPSSRKPLGQFDTLISSTTSVRGDIHFSGGLHIDGRVEGNLIAEDNSDAVLRVSEVGEVTGDIIAPHVIINGTVNGDLYAAQHLELAEKAAINGSVYYNLLEMAMGAEVNGSLVRQKEPPRKLLDHMTAGGEAPVSAEGREKSASGE